MEPLPLPPKAPRWQDAKVWQIGEKNSIILEDGDRIRLSGGDIRDAIKSGKYIIAEPGMLVMLGAKDPKTIEYQDKLWELISAYKYEAATKFCVETEEEGDITDEQKQFLRLNMQLSVCIGVSKDSRIGLYDRFRF